MIFGIQERIRAIKCVFLSPDEINGELKEKEYLAAVMEFTFRLSLTMLSMNYDRSIPETRCALAMLHHCKPAHTPSVSDERCLPVGPAACFPIGLLQDSIGSRGPCLGIVHHKL